MHTHIYISLSTARGCQRSGRQGHRGAGGIRPRAFRRVPAQGASGVELQPLINAIGVEVVVALRDAPQSLFGLVLRQADRAKSVVWFRKSPALAQNGYRIRFDCLAV